MGWIKSKTITKEFINDVVIPYHEDAFKDKIHSTDGSFMIVIRDYYFQSMGKSNSGDFNILDGLIVMANRNSGYFELLKGNADPSFAGRRKARFIPQVMRMYRGDHRGQYWAFRPYPEGKRHACTRDGRTSYCSHTNFHGCRDSVDGRGYDTWSEGCITTPITFFRKTLRPEFYDQIKNHHETIDTKATNYRWGGRETKNGVKHFPLILMEKRLDRSGVPRIYTGLNEPLDVGVKPIVTSTQKYIVQSGDFLLRIARKFGVTPSYIRQMNGIRGDLIKVGQELEI